MKVYRGSAPFFTMCIGIGVEFGFAAAPFFMNTVNAVVAKTSFHFSISLWVARILCVLLGAAVGCMIAKKQEFHYRTVRNGWTFLLKQAAFVVLVVGAVLLPAALALSAIMVVVGLVVGAFLFVVLMSASGGAPDRKCKTCKFCENEGWYYKCKLSGDPVDEERNVCESWIES